MKRKQLNNKEIRSINQKIVESYEIENFFSKKEQVEIIDEKIIAKEGKPAFMYVNEKIVPTLHTLLQNNFLKKIIIDMPAVKFIANGADVMRPGIVEIQDFEKDAIIAIIDEKNHRPLAVGKALFDSETMKGMDKGKVIKNIHFVGDEIWTIQ